MAAAPIPGAGTRGKAPRPPREGQPVRIGVIGPGGMGTAHVDSILSLVKQGLCDVQIVAVADVCDVHAKRAAGKCDAAQDFKCETYRDYRDLLKREDVHGVIIASPEHWHARHAIDAMLAGKDVYCEKPMTLRLEEAIAMRETAKANPDVICQIGTQKIMLPKYLEAKKLIEADAIGHPTFSQTSYCRNSPDGEWNYYGLNPEWKPGVNLDWDAWCGHLGPREWDPKVYARWRRYKDFSTGIIGDLLVHEVTPLYMTLEERIGWPTRVTAMGSHLIDKEMENHDQVNLNIEFEGGHHMIIAGSTCNEVGLENLIRGHKGNIYLNSNNCVVRPTRPYVDDIDQQTIRFDDIGNDQDKLRLNWFRVMQTREEPDSNIERGTRVMVMVDLATKSMWDGHAYAFDHESLRITKI